MNVQTLYQLFLKHPSIQTDTRKLKAGDLFVALKGPSFNGNEFAAKALELGAAYAIIDEKEFDKGEQTILVKDALETLQQLASYHRDQFSIPFIGITGSNGKTTTKELIHAVLSTKFKTYTTEGNLNNHIGVPLTLLKIKSDADVAVIEMGANHLREIASYCEIAKPTHGLITNCGKAHLEGFGSEEGVRKGKGELFDYLRAHDGTAFIMSDYQYLEEMSAGIKDIVKYGTAKGELIGEASLQDEHLKVEFSKGFNGSISTNLVGEYNLPNVLAAVSIGKYFQIEGEIIKRAIENYEPTNSRSQLIKKGDSQIILDAYNANPSSMKLAIENFSKSKSQNKILALGAMAEMGASSIAEHEAIIQLISQHDWKAVMLVGGDFQNLQHHYQSFENAAQAGEWLSSHLPKNASILIKGSRSMKMEKILDYI